MHYGDTMATKTNAVRLVQQAGIPCREAFYEYDEKDLNGNHAAAAIGFMAIDPAIFGDAKAIKDHLSDYLQTLRNSPKAEGQTRIYTHGEKEVEAEKKLMENGIPVNDNTMVEVYEMCQYLDMDFSKYFGDYIPEKSAGFKSPETFK